MDKKPLGKRNYGSIPHLPGSRTGPSDRTCHWGQARIATEKFRDGNDQVIVTEKLDGSNVGVARINNEIVALGRAGYLASSSPFLQHRIFATWVARNEARFRMVLGNDERVVGEWMIQAHGTLYEMPHEPFVAFDLFVNGKRLPYRDVEIRVSYGEFQMPGVVSRGQGPISIESVMDKLSASGYHGAHVPEGAVWRVERRKRFDFMVKYVRPGKVDGCFLDDENPTWNSFCWFDCAAGDWFRDPLLFVERYGDE